MRPLSEISIQFVKGVGPARKKTFERLGVQSVEDLLYLFPRRYEDRSQLKPIKELVVGVPQTVSALVLSLSGRKSWHTKKHVYELVVGDQTGQITCVWFNRPYLDKYFKMGQRVILYGKVDTYKGRLQMVSPDYEIIDDEDEDASLSAGRIVPIYPLTRGMTQRYLRKTIQSCLKMYGSQAQEVLPYDLRRQYQLDNLVRSLANIHFPENFDTQKIAYKRVSFEEFFLFQVSVILRRLDIVRKPGVAHVIEPGFLDQFASLFDFSFTDGQRQAIEEITADMRSGYPMHRLLQGDVGCGKTVVAFFGCLAAVTNGYQAAIMAPTEILARQHYERLKTLLVSKALRAKKIKPELLLNTSEKKARDRILAGLRKGSVDILIGTHALIQESVEFKNLSFVVVDEQHKFGVRQRAVLSAKGKNPDVLVMTATPIPRTLCLTLYGDLDISTIRDMPPGRGTVQTLLFHPEGEAQAYARVREAVKKGEQAYVVYPVVDESDKVELRSAEEMFARFQENEFKDFRLGLVHGQMKKDQSKTVMHQFKEKKIDILVATTVLEVGVDVPNATVMLIEHADRFGLSQLHQLRGRIGRGERGGQCLLLAEATTSEAQARLSAIVSTLDGFEIAQQDLIIRGPGEFFGRHQHGLNELKIANPQTQLDILEDARKEAIALTTKDPLLDNGANRMIRETILRRYPTYLANVLSG